jgi:hypothetical protein
VNMSAYLTTSSALLLDFAAAILRH